MNRGLMKNRARTLRRNMTDAELALWHRLRKRQLNDCLFRRQYPIGRYIVDFICLEQRVVIEVDGGQHLEQKDYDEKRTDWLAKQGYLVLRFWNNEVLCELDAVVTTIFHALSKE